MTTGGSGISPTVDCVSRSERSKSFYPSPASILPGAVPSLLRDHCRERKVHEGLLSSGAKCDALEGQAVGFRYHLSCKDEQLERQACGVPQMAAMRKKEEH